MSAKKLALWSLGILGIIPPLLIFVFLRGASDGLLHIYFLDIGQGDAIYIVAPNGSEFIVDGGPEENLSRALAPIRSFNDHFIDGILVTNPDADHYHGFISLMDHNTIPIEIEPGTFSPTPTYKSFEDKLQSTHVTKYIAHKGMNIILDKERNVSLQILFPDMDVSHESSNDGSTVAKLVYGKTSVMLQGDAPIKVEDRLLKEDSSILDADILKVGHHGSRTASSLAYVKAVSPDFAVVSLGKNNRYGHPHKEMLTTMETLHVPLLRTDEEGTIEFVSDGERIVRKN